MALPTYTPAPEPSLEEFLRANFAHLPESEKLSVLRDMAASRHGYGTPEPVRGPLDAIGQIVRDPFMSSEAFGMEHRNGMTTPASYAKAMVRTMDAAKDLLEFFAAQDNMDLFKDKPLVKQMYTRVISVGMQDLFGRINR